MQRKDEEWFLRPITDVHYGHPGHDREMFKETLDLIEKNDNYLAIGLGDYVENNTVTGRGAKTYDEEMPKAKIAKQQALLPSQEIREFREL